MTYVLQFTALHDHTEKWFLCNLGEQWPRQPERRLIERTSRERKEAKEFANEEDARACLVVAGDPKGWEILEEKL